MTATKPRRSGRKGEGSIFKRKDASGKVIGYVAVLSLGIVNGKRKRRNFLRPVDERGPGPDAGRSRAAAHRNPADGW